MSTALEQDTFASDSPSGKPKRKSWFKDPWRKPRVLASATWIYLVWSLAPVLIAVLFAFNNGRSRSVFQFGYNDFTKSSGPTLNWFCGEAPVPNAWSICGRPELADAIVQTLVLAILTVLVTVPIGVAFALGIDRWRGRPARASNFTMLLSFVTPELIMGVALFLTFAKLLTFVTLGTQAQVLGLVMFQVSYPVIIVRARLSTIGKEYEEAAMDLGARPAQALRRVLLPLLYPAIFASGVIIFADVIDDFVLVRSLCKEAACETISMKIYGGYRSAPTPALNAMATLMLVGTMAAVGIGALIYKVIARKQEGEKVDTARDFAMQI